MQETNRIGEMMRMGGVKRMWGVVVLGTMLPLFSFASNDMHSVLDADLPFFEADAEKTFYDFNSLVVPTEHRLHVLVDGGFDMTKKSEILKSKEKSANFLTKVLLVSEIELSEQDRASVIFFLSEMPQAQGLSASMEIRPAAREKKIETLCRIGLKMDASDKFLLDGMFDDEGNIAKMKARAQDMGVSPKDLQEYFLVHEMSHCVFGMSSHPVLRHKRMSFLEDQSDTLRKESFADALSAVFWIRSGRPKSVFDYIVENRVVEFKEYQSLDHMTAPVINEIFRRFDSEGGRSALVRMTAREMIGYAFDVSEKMNPSKGDVARVLFKNFPGMLLKMRDAGTLDDKWADVRGYLATRQDNDLFWSSLSAVLKRKPVKKEMEVSFLRRYDFQSKSKTGKERKAAQRS